MAFINATFSSAASGDITAVAAVTGVPIKVWRIYLANAVATAQALTLKDGSTALTGAISLPSAVGGALNLDAGASGVPLFIVSAGNAFVVNESAATSVTGYIQYTLG